MSDCMDIMGNSMCVMNWMVDIMINWVMDIKRLYMDIMGNWMVHVMGIMGDWMVNIMSDCMDIMGISVVDIMFDFIEWEHMFEILPLTISLLVFVWSTMVFKMPIIML